MPVACFLYHCDCVLSANFWISFKSFDIEHGQWTCGQIFWGKFFTIFFQRWKMSHIQSIVTGEKAYPMKSKQVLLFIWRCSFAMDRNGWKQFNLLEKQCKIISVQMENQMNSHIRIPRQYSSPPPQVVGAGSDRPRVCSSARARTTFQPRKGFTLDHRDNIDKWWSSSGCRGT